MRNFKTVQVDKFNLTIDIESTLSIKSLSIIRFQILLSHNKDIIFLGRIRAGKTQESLQILFFTLQIFFAHFFFFVLEVKSTYNCVRKTITLFYIKQNVKLQTFAIAQILNLCLYLAKNQ